MTVLSGIHNHSVFSDGKNTPEEMAQAAVEKGFVSFGISDHSFTFCDSSYCMKKDALASYLAACRDLKDKVAGRIEFFVGIEKDGESKIDYADYDFVIGSVHYVHGKSGAVYPVDSGAAGQLDFVAKECGGDRLELARIYYDAVAEHALKEPFPILGHFDLLNKYGLFDGAGEPYEKIALAALDAVLEKTPYFEVNTGAVARGLRKDPYPAPVFLRHIREKGGRVILSADAHSADKIDFFFPEALALLRKIGFTEVYRLRKTGFERVPLDPA